VSTLARVPERRVTERLVVVACALAISVGVVARFVTRSPLWLDEALSVNIAKLSFSDLVTALRQDGHPPLYYLVLKVWMSFFGSGDTSVRALSGVFGVAHIALAWLVGSRIGHRLHVVHAGWLAGAVTALTPFAVRYSTETRMYALIMMLVLLGWWALDTSVRRRSVPATVTLALVTALLVWTQYWAIYLVAVTWLGLAWWVVIRRSSAARWALGAVTVGAATFIGWLGVFFDQVRTTGTPWAPPARPTVTASASIVDLGGFSADAALFGMLVCVVGVLGVVGHRRVDVGPADDPRDAPLELTWSGERGLHREAAIAIGALAVGSVATFVGRSAFASRYVAIVVPIVLVFAGVGVARLRGWAQLSVFGLLVVAAIPGIAYNVRTDRTQGREVAQLINELAAPNDLVVICPDQMGPATQRSLRSDVRVGSYPNLTSPLLVDWRNYATRNRSIDPLVAARSIIDRAGDSTVFLVWQGGYRTLEGQCEALFAELSTTRVQTQELTARRGVFEPMQLTSFRVP
jgi:mannosyltransferase